MSLTSTRQSLMAELEADLGIPFVPGLLEGPMENRDLGCVYPVAKRENEDNVQEEILEYKVRVFRRFQAARDVENPVDPAPVEALAELIQTSLKEKQAAQFGVWFFRVTSVEIDVETQGVEATIICLQPNPFAQGG